MRFVARLVLASMALVALALLGRTLVLRDFSFLGASDIAQLAMVYVVPLGSFSALAIYLALSRRNLQVLGLLLIVSVATPLYLTELYLQYSYYDNSGNVRRAAERAHRPYDSRSGTEVVADLRRQGIDAHPFFRLLRWSDELMPLGNSPGKMIVYCNEVGEYLVFRADQHGFNNPDSVWDHLPNDLVLLGDSYTHGACALENNGFAKMIRRRLPRTVNLAVGGNNPQLNLASIVEYGPYLRPRNTVWFHYAGNDLSGMMQYKDHAILRRYIDEEFSQGLIHRSSEVEQIMEGFFAENLEALRQATDSPSPLGQILLTRKSLFHLLKLNFVRGRLGLVQASSADVDFTLFADIVERMAARARAIGTRLHFVSLPAISQVGLPSTPKIDRVRAIVEAADIPYYDLAPVFTASGDIGALYAFGLNGGHLSERGNELVALFVIETVLRADRP